MKSKFILLGIIIIAVLVAFLLPKDATKLDPNEKIPDSLKACNSDSDCIMAGGGEGPSYESLACGCINEKYKYKVEGECNINIMCPCENICECINRKCTLKEVPVE